MARKGATGVLVPYGGAVGASLARTDLGALSPDRGRRTGSRRAGPSSYRWAPSASAGRARNSARVSASAGSRASASWQTTSLWAILVSPKVLPSVLLNAIGA